MEKKVKRISAAVEAVMDVGVKATDNAVELLTVLQAAFLITGKMCGLSHDRLSSMVRERPLPDEPLPTVRNSN